MIVISTLTGCAPVTLEPPAIESPMQLEAPPIGEGIQIGFGPFVVPPHDEVWLCEVYELPTSTYSHVNWVEYEQTAGTHHMTLSTLGLDGQSDAIAPGTYDCEDLYNNSSLMQEQIMFFGAQGDAEGTLHLPEGVAASMPPAMTIIHEMHYVNAFDEAVELFSNVNAWTLSDNEVEEGIWGGQVRDETLDVPDGQITSEWTRCVMNEDVDVLFLASHTHELGVEFTVKLFDGENAGEEIYLNTDLHTPLITQYDPPLHIPAGTGFEYSCTWDNDSGEDKFYGPTSEDEMCNLAIVHMPFSITAQCDVVETSDGVLWQPGD